MARPFAAMPDVARKLLSGELKEALRFEGENLPVMEQLKWFQEKMSSMANEEK